MPYENEHSCRLREPSEFDRESIRRIDGKTKTGKIFSMIIGKLKGKDKTTAQALRFPKDKWSAEEARAVCEREKGRFEAAG